MKRALLKVSSLLLIFEAARYNFIFCSNKYNYAKFC